MDGKLFLLCNAKFMSAMKIKVLECINHTSLLINCVLQTLHAIHGNRILDNFQYIIHS